jgi:glycosyl transferase family 25
MKLYVISLPDAEERRERATIQLADAGIPFEFFEALRGEQAMAEGHFERCDDDEWLLNTGREVTPAEIGCFASHRSMWQKCVELGEPIMIMEDDFQLLPGFADAIKQVARNIDECGFIRLQGETRARRERVAKRGQFTLWRYTKAPHSMMCNAITPEVAQRFVEMTRVACEPVDVFIKKFWEHGQPIYGLTPYTVTESCLSRKTCIPDRHKARKDLKVRTTRFLRKCSWEVQRVRASRENAKKETPGPVSA